MKTKMLGIIFLFLLLFMGIPCSLCAGDLYVLRTAAQESFPKYYKLSENKMGGVCVDIIQAIEKVDSEIKFTGYQEFLPFKRLQVYLEKGQLDVFFGFKKTEKRTEKYHFLDVPLYEINYVVAVRADNKVKINALNDIRSLGEKGTILTVYGTAASNYLYEQGGLFIDDEAKTPLLALKKLIAQRGNFVFYHDLGLKSLIKKEKLEKQVAILPVSFLTYYHFAAFSKKMSAETIDQVKIAIEKLNENNELSRICSNYFLGR